MPLVKLPDPEPGNQISDIERFAKAYFGIELTKQQLEFIRAVAQGNTTKLVGRRAGIGMARKVLNLYLLEGIKPDGRARLPIFSLPAHLGRSKIKAATQEGKVLAMIKRPGGAFNFELSRIALKYTSVISELRKEGHGITAHRQYLKNGKASNTYLYTYGGQRNG